METYPRAAVERAMKVQEVILRAVDKKITWAQAGEVIGLCERQMRRWKERYQEFGYDGLFESGKKNGSGPTEPNGWLAAVSCAKPKLWSGSRSQKQRRSSLVTPFC
jgi:hypothetical protein